MAPRFWLCFWLLFVNTEVVQCSSESKTATWLKAGATKLCKVCVATSNLGICSLLILYLGIKGLISQSPTEVITLCQSASMADLFTL